MSVASDALISCLLAQSDGGVAERAGSLGIAPYVVLGAYLLLLLVLGIAGWLKSTSGEEDYYLAGRGQGWVVSSLTIMATFFSSFALLGAPGMVYKEGVLFAIYSLNVPVAGICVYILGSRIWKAGRKFGYVTPGDMASDYYGSRRSLRILIAVTSVLYALPYIVMQIQAGGIMSQTMFGGERAFVVGAILLATITMLYIMIGGMRSVAWTDIVQGLLLISGMLVSGFAMLLLFGGPAEFGRQLTSSLPDSSLTLPGNSGIWSWTLLLTICLFGSAGSMVQPAQWMRFYAAKGPRTLKRGAIIFAVVLTSCFIVGVMLIGLAGQVLYPLVFEYRVAVPEGPAVLEGEPGPGVRQHFQYIPPAPAEKPGERSGTGTIAWKWLGRDRAGMTDAELGQLKALSGNAHWEQSLLELQARTASGTERPKVSPNPAVDPNPAPPDSYDAILTTVLQEKLPATLGAFGAIFASLIFVAIMAASMSTADSNLHALSAVLTRDVYDQFIRPNAGERERVWIGRCVIVLFTLFALVIVIYSRNPSGVLAKSGLLGMIAEMGLTAIDFSTQLLPLTIDMLFIRRGTGKGAAWGLAAGLLTAFLFGPLFVITVKTIGDPAPLKTCVDFIGGINGLLPMHKSVWGLMVNVPVFILVSSFTSRPSPEKVEAFRKALQTSP